MNTILTNDERRTVIKSVRHGLFTDPVPDDVARAVEAAVLAKLAKQSPDVEPDEAFELGLERVEYYTHPAPQQADRQRVPVEWREAVKVAREALMEAICVAKWPELQFKQVVVQGLEAALEQLDSLEGGVA